MAYTWLTRTSDSLELFVYVYFFFVVGCLGHDDLEGVRPPVILGSDSLDLPF